MPDLRQQLEEDRAMRDMAKKLVTNDLHNLRSGVEHQGVGSRMAVRLREGAEGIGDEVSEFARANPGQIGTGAAVAIAALLGWIFRDRLSDALRSLFHNDDAEADPGELAGAEQEGVQHRSIN